MLQDSLHHRSTLPAARRSCVLQPAQPKGYSRQHARLAGPPAALPGATLALVLGFLPWTGCSQGGFYDTGVHGVHGSNCQAMYQPAAAAEARFAASLRGNSSNPASSSSGTNSGASAAAAEQSSDPSQPSSPTAAATADLKQQQQQQDVSLSQQVHDVMPDAAKDLVRDILREDNRARTKQLVDDAWQTLE